MTDTKSITQAIHDRKLGFYRTYNILLCIANKSNGNVSEAVESLRDLFDSTCHQFE